MISQIKELKEYDENEMADLCTRTEIFITTERVPLEAFEYECDIIRNKVGQWFGCLQTTRDQG